jgi:hypothetical protein
MSDPVVQPIRITAHGGIDVEITDSTEEVREDRTTVQTVWFTEWPKDEEPVDV